MGQELCRPDFIVSDQPKRMCDENEEALVAEVCALLIAPPAPTCILQIIVVCLGVGFCSRAPSRYYPMHEHSMHVNAAGHSE